MKSATYSIWADGVEVFDFHFRTLWAAQYKAAESASRLRRDCHVVDDLTGEIMFIYSTNEHGHQFAAYIAPDALGITYPDGVIISKEA